MSMTFWTVDDIKTSSEITKGSYNNQERLKQFNTGKHYVFFNQTTVYPIDEDQKESC